MMGVSSSDSQTKRSPATTFIALTLISCLLVSALTDDQLVKEA